MAFLPTLLPSMTAIVLAMATRQVIPSLVLGLMAGANAVARSPLGGISKTIDYAVGSAIILFLGFGRLLTR